jgi:hypothetical protein
MAWMQIVQAIKTGINDTLSGAAQPIAKWSNIQNSKPAVEEKQAAKNQQAATEGIQAAGSQLVSDAVTKSSDTGTSGIGFQGSGTGGVGGGAGIKEGQDFIGSLSDKNQKENIQGSVLKSWMSEGKNHGRV